MIKLKRHGSYLKTDENNFVIPVANKNLLQKEWTPLINEVVDHYKNIFQSNLISVYIRGSVAKGEAVPHISDLDSFCLITKKMNLDETTIKNINNQLVKKFPFCTHIEFISIIKENVFKGFPPRKRGVWAELIKTQSVCVYGSDMSAELEPFLLSDMIGHAYYLERDLDKLKGFFEEDKDNSKAIKETCVWITRRIIRSGFDLVIMKEEKFTRDLYLCFESFSKYYPEKINKMKNILNLSLNPVSDVREINHFLDEICPWLISEIKTKLK